MSQQIAPDYRITNLKTGKDLTQVLRPWVLSLSLTESADNKTDTLEIKLNGDGVNTFPSAGTPLGIALGYVGSPLIDFGSYKVDTEALSGPPLVLTITAGASDFNAPYKIQKTRHFDKKTLGSILKTVADNNDIEAVIDATLDSVVVPYLGQQNESDMAMVSRLSEEHGAYGTIKGGKLVFMPKDVAVKTIPLTISDVLNYKISWHDRPQYDAVVAGWREINAAVSHTEVFDGKQFTAVASGKVAEVKTQSYTKLEARKLAKALWLKLHQLRLSATFTLPGRPGISSRMGLKLNGFSSSLDGGVLFISSTKSMLTNTGYITTVRATMEKKDV